MFVAESIVSTTQASPVQICAEEEICAFFPCLFFKYRTSFAYQRKSTCHISNIGLYDNEAFSFT